MKPIRYLLVGLLFLGMISSASCGGGGGGGGGANSGGSVSTGTTDSGSSAPQPSSAQGTIVSGTVQAPHGTVAFSPRLRLFEKLAHFLISDADAGLTGVSPVPDDTVVELVRINDAGVSIKTLASTKVVGGAYSFDLSGLNLTFDSSLVVQVTNPATGFCMRAFVSSQSVNIDPVSEAVVRIVIAKIAATPGSSLSCFTPQELSDFRGGADVLTTVAQTNAGGGLEAAVGAARSVVLSDANLSAFLDSAAAPGQTSMGPGDTGDYFPVNDGNRWETSDTAQQTGSPSTNTTGILEIAGAKVLGGVQTIVFRTCDSAGSALSEDYRVKTAAGIIYYGNNDPTDKITPQLGPYFEERFPLQVGSTFEAFNKSGLDSGQDLDGDGIDEPLSLQAQVTVLGFEPITVAAGTFQNCAKIQTVLTETLTSSLYGSQVTMTATIVEWYAPGVGPVKREYSASAPQWSSTSSSSLVAYNADGSSNLTTPSITSVQPNSLVNNVSQVSAIFNQDMDPSTLNGLTFTITNSSDSPVAGTVSYSNRTATFVPASSFASDTYTATISTGVQNIVGVPLSNSDSWSFTLDNVSPTVLSFTPADKSTNVPITAAITATFSEDMDPAGAPGWFNVTDASGSAVSGKVSYANRTATFVPYVLSANTKYKVGLNNNQTRDPAGNWLAGNYSWAFTTGAGLFLPFSSIGPGGGYPSAVAVGDLNGDGRSDVVMSGVYEDQLNGGFIYKLLVFMQDQSGNLSSPVMYDVGKSAVTSIAIGDMNHDGRNDIVVGTVGAAPGTSSGVGVLLQNASGTFDPMVFYPTNDSQPIRLADLNNDGRLDVVAVGWGTNTVSVFFQNEAGTLDPPVVYNATHTGNEIIEVGDVNNDGLPDIIVTSGNNSSSLSFSVLLQKADGTFDTPVQYSVDQGTFLQGLAVGDVNNDGLNDVVVSYMDGSFMPKIAVLLQNSSGRLSAPVEYDTQYNPGPLRIADVEGDGRKGVIELHDGYNEIGVFRQAADGSLMPEERYYIPDDGAGNERLAIGDINGDGLNDVVVANTNYGLQVLYHAPTATSAPGLRMNSLFSSGSSKMKSPTSVFVGTKIRNF